MSNSASTEWITDELVRFCDIIGGGTPDRAVDEFWGGQIPWLSPTEVTSLASKYISKTKEGLTQLGLDKSSAKLHPPGTLLMTSRASIGYVAINTVPMATNQGFQSLRCKDGTLAEYMYQYITWARPELERLSAGSTFSEISSVNVKRLRVTLPPLPEQQKIATILSSVDDVIEKTRAQIDKLKDLKTGMMQELLTKGIGHTEFKDSAVGRIPVSWQITKVGEVSKVKRGASPRPIQDPKWWGGKVGWVRISDVTSSRKYLTKTTQYLSGAGVSKSVQIPKGEVVLSICATIGRPIIVKVDACIHDGFVWFEKLRDSIDREFWYYFLASKEELLSSQRQSGTQGNLNTSIVSELDLPLPPQHEQEKIAAIMASIDIKIEKMLTKLSKLENQKKALMQDLLTGKVRVNLTDKESAVV